MVAPTSATDIGFAAESDFLALVVDLSPRFRGALEAQQLAARAQFLRGELGSKLIACLGVDVQAPGAAPGLERCGPQDGTVDATTLCAKALLPLFGGSLPFGVRPMQLVTVRHQSLDLAEVLGQIPGHAGCLNGVCAHG